MRCPKQPPAEEAQHAHLLQQLGGPGMFWQPYPFVPQPAFNPWIAAQHPMTGPIPPQSHIPGPGERPSWFQGLVAAVSKEIKDGAEDSRSKNAAAPASLSVEDEKALVNALKKQKQGVMTMEEVFRELSQKYGRTEAEWKTFFFANYERLISRLNVHSNVGRASAGDPGSIGSSVPVASRTRSASTRNGPSRSSTSTALSTLSESSEESDPESESESESEMEWEELSSSGKSDGPRPHAKAKGTTKTRTSPSGTTKPAREAKPFAPVMDADLRAMAQYRFEHGDDDGEPGRYSTPRWREFADRPENHKRTLKAWTCVPRNHKHAAAIDRYVEEYRRRGDVADSKPVLPILPQGPGNIFPTASAPAAGMQLQTQAIGAEATQDLKMGAGRENKTDGLGSENTARVGPRTVVDRMEIIDLTDEKE